MMTGEEKKEYWYVVRECLIAFHGVSKSDANRMALSYWKEIESAEPEIKIDVFYHNEPFEVACDISGHHLDLDEATFGIYTQIRMGKPTQVR